MARYGICEMNKAEFDLRWELDNECWHWLGSLSPNGYGRYGRHSYAHRLSYELHIGPIPEGLVIDHLCRNRWCVNPVHLEAVRQRTNLLRGEGWAGRHARQTHCLHGHPLTAENIRVYADGHGRQCKTCDRERAARKRAAE